MTGKTTLFIDNYLPTIPRRLEYKHDSNTNMQQNAWRHRVVTSLQIRTKQSFVFSPPVFRDFYLLCSFMRDGNSTSTQYIIGSIGSNSEPFISIALANDSSRLWDIDQEGGKYQQKSKLKLASSYRRCAILSPITYTNLVQNVRKEEGNTDDDKIRQKWPNCQRRCETLPFI